ncbi:MAG: glutamine synthetase III [Candidatus Riflebacteria bacterium]|nr:glutamine synthetase III [Candidatus Riflebacteria bacterium]
MQVASKIFGELTFNKNVMREKLNSEVYEKLISTIQIGKSLDETIAAEVAHAMKEWAILNGATHFTHWFQPQRGGSAEKHDAFISFTDDGQVIERFSAKQLIQSEPDASSFPSGGIRSTFEARGYTAWDPTSPAFLIEAARTRTLVIPSVFLSWTGEVLDIKTPLLRSMRALNKAGIKLQRLLGNRAAKKMIVFAGPEQEYFIVSKKLYDTRPDLRICGRTIFGASPEKGQQMEDHYFGSIHHKVLCYMEDLDLELHRRGIPAKTRHNEVSPNQFEVAPIYEEANLAVDHNLQMMDIMKKVATKHDMVVLLQEKPFAGVNGSGKHVNYSLGDNSGSNYLEPSASPMKNINFLLTLGALLLGVDKYGALLRAAVADAGNDHRLGANEAPPAIMSVYFGEYLTKLLDEIEGVSSWTEQSMANISMGVKNLPKIAKDYSDRNRTSPIAFTGNKFEFRAVGSSQNPSEAVMTMNLLVTYGYEVLEKRISEEKGEIRERAHVVLRDVIKETKRVRFEGNNYSEEWHAEAKKRGLPNSRNTPSAVEAYLKKDAVKLFESHGILSERELRAKVEIKLETYTKTKEIEYRVGVNVARTQILPAVSKQIIMTGNALRKLKECGLDSKLLEADLRCFESLYSEIHERSADLEKILNNGHNVKSSLEHALYLGEEGEKALSALRNVVDQAEKVLSADLWPMAKYQELITAI